MKINLSIQEAETVLADAMKFDFIHSRPEVSIAPDNTVNAPSFPLWKAVETVRSFRHSTDQKIAAIKALRQFASDNGTQLGLLDAKLFVEAISVARY